MAPSVAYYRTARGGHVPLSAGERAELLELYSDHRRPVREIAELFGVRSGSVYRWLPLLGVRPLAERDVTPLRAPRRRRQMAS